MKELELDGWWEMTAIIAVTSVANALVGGEYNGNGGWLVMHLLRARAYFPM